MYYFFLVNTLSIVQIISPLNGDGARLWQTLPTFTLSFFLSTICLFMRAYALICLFFRSISDKSHRFTFVYVCTHHNESMANWKNGDVLSMTIL